jgi:hypothetical protein
VGNCPEIAGGQMSGGQMSAFHGTYIPVILFQVGSQVNPFCSLGFCPVLQCFLFISSNEFGRNEVAPSFIDFRKLI